MNRIKLLIYICGITLLLSGCGSKEVIQPPVNHTAELRLNHIQLMGSHNSYKRPISPSILQLIAQHDEKRALALDYSHPSINEQLTLGLRQLEIDIVKDPEGGRFSYPLGEKIARKTLLTDQERELLRQPGFKVMHQPDLDFSSHCILFIQCLEQLLTFTEQNPRHLPIMVLMNLKEKAVPNIDGAPVLPFLPDDYDELDRVLVRVLGNQLITPEEIRAQEKSLRQAVLKVGWPDLERLKGRYIFVLDGNEKQRNIYRNGYPSLSGRSLFASYPDTEPEAAVMVVNDPVSQFTTIQNLVRRGFLVRTRSDGSNQDAINQNQNRVERAFSSGAHWISTDFYPTSPQSQRFKFVVGEDKQFFYRCNPVIVFQNCKLNE